MKDAGVRGSEWRSPEQVGFSAAAAAVSLVGTVFLCAVAALLKQAGL